MSRKNDCTNLGFIDHALSPEEIEALPFITLDDDYEGARISCYLPMELDELTEPDERGLVYDIEARILESRKSWELEEVFYEPVFVDEQRRIVLSVRGIICPA